MTDPGFLYLARADVVAACEDLDAVALVREALLAHASGRARLPTESYLDWSPPQGCARSIAMTGFVNGVPGVKVINANPANVKHGLPRASGLTMLLDPQSARVRCVMDATYISALRTAAVTCLSAELLSGPSLEAVAILGAGELAAAHLRLLSARLPGLRSVRVFDRDLERASRLSERLGRPLGERGIELRIAREAEEAVRSAQLVVPVTTTTSGYIPFEWLGPGSLLVNVSLDDPLPDVMTRADHLYVDDWNAVRADGRRLLGRMARQGGVCGPSEPLPVETCRRIDGTLGDLLAGRRLGRCSSDEVIVVNPFGLAIEDVAVAVGALETAAEKGLGVRLPA